MIVSAHSALDEKQLAQVAYLFADEFFGTDASAYLYELNKSGEVTGRVKLMQGNQLRAKMRPQVVIGLRQEVNVTEEMINKSQMHMNALAASMAQDIYKKQFEEVQQ